MAEIVNLRRARKEKRRAEKEAEADNNRRASGRSKAEKGVTAQLRTLDSARLEGHRLGGKRDDDPEA
jgi:hypothetical protein